jgi:hypothetical protein
VESFERKGLKKWPKSRFLSFDFWGENRNLNENLCFLHGIWGLIKNFLGKFFFGIPI